MTHSTRSTRTPIDRGLWPETGLDIRRAPAAEMEGYLGRAGMRPVRDDVAAIVAAIKGGEPAADVARRLGISRQRIHQLWRKVMAESSRQAPAVLTCPRCDAQGPYEAIRAPGHFRSEEHAAAVRARREARFWALVEKGPGCWTWHGYALDNRGIEQPVTTWNGERTYAYRVTWELANGPIPKGMWAGRMCAGGRCVNPDHVIVGTPSDVLRAARGPRRRGGPAV